MVDLHEELSMNTERIFTEVSNATGLLSGKKQTELY